METVPMEHRKSSQHDEPLPKFPQLPGPLGRLVEAITPDIPYEHKALSVLTCLGLALSGRARLASPYDHLQPRFYACLIGSPGTGKSAAQHQVVRMLQALMSKVHVEFSIDSGPALVGALEEHPHLLYVPDELLGAFQKARHGKIFADLLRLYESNEIGRRVVNRTVKLTNVHFAMVGTATPQGFGDMWQGTRGGSSGLQSRFVLSFSEQYMPDVRNPNEEPALSQALDELEAVLRAEQPEISLPEKVGDFTFGLIGDGSRIDRERSSRVLDMGRRFALLLAACSGKTQIDNETMKLGAAFIDYQIAVHKRLMPDDASNAVQAFENRILAFLKRNPERRATQRDARNNLKPDKSPGGLGAFNQAFANLIRARMLEKAGSNRAGYELWKLDD